MLVSELVSAISTKSSDPVNHIAMADPVLVSFIVLGPRQKRWDEGRFLCVPVPTPIPAPRNMRSILNRNTVRLAARALVASSMLLSFLVIIDRNSRLHAIGLI